MSLPQHATSHLLPETKLPASNPATRERQNSQTEPSFTPKTITIRRISPNPTQPDIIQRVNSLISSIHIEDDPNSDMLPYGGRKSSIPSLSSVKAVRGMSMGMSIEDGVMDAGERRPSVLSCGDGQGLEVRSINAGGGEDVVSVRGAGAGDAPRESQGLSFPPHSTQQADRRAKSPQGLFQAWHGFPPKDTHVLTDQGDGIHPGPSLLPEGTGGNGKNSQMVRDCELKQDHRWTGQAGPPVIPMPEGLEHDKEYGWGIAL